MENESLTEGDIFNNNDNVDWLSESTDYAEDITDNESDEFDKEVYLRVTLTEWASRGVSKRKVNSLLSLLRRVHPELPKTYVTLLNTPKTTVVTEIDNGHIWYKGIKRNLDFLLTQEYLDTHGRIRLNISIDGLPLDSCGKLHFWPILGSLADKTCEPFIICVYFGIESKPSTLEQFLEYFIIEMEELSTNGFEFNNYIYTVSIYNFICDAPARSFIKYTIGHNGLFSCEKCEVKGEWYHNRMVYLNNGQKRTDQTFIDRRNPEHHLGLSPLEERLYIGMVSQFRLEYLHLVCVGVMKRFLMRLLEIRNRGKLRDEDIETFKNTLARIGQFIPKGFTRKPYRFKKVSHLKATELRRFLLYDGVKIMKDHTSNRTYHTFLLLHCSIYICFPYENYLKTIKQSLRSGYHPLQQLAKRDFETNGRLSEPKNIIEGIKLTGNHIDPNETVEGQHYKILTNNNFTLRCVAPDNYFKTEDYAVVTFTGKEQEDEKETIAVVPVKWIDKPDDEITDMFWPPKNWPERGSRLVHLKKAVQNCIEPEIQWPLHKGTVLHLYLKNIHVFQVGNKERKEASRKPSVENHASRIKVLQEFQNNSSQSCEQKQLKKVCNSQYENNINKKHEKQRKIDNIKQKNFVSSKTIQKKRNF
ncbi:hypothetical protein ALC62_13537 [Cyphomyrmex costatus]|uniref:Transposase domain-containing protein n=1 Tax=Cyphomyrmex costatus TaxID=456900 RepID=A0A151I9R3_9HYME|nr:hypothetical protein ALC62_13537 [Cyphomyrmex costatus]